MLHIAHKRIVPVEFLDLPGHPLDDSLFAPHAHTTLATTGLSISPLGIIHAASIHYSGKFPNSRPLRLLNAFFDIFVNVTPNSGNDLLINDHETPEFQTNSSEVIAAGLCISTTSRLFSIPHSRISQIHTNGKRCDYRFTLNNRSYVIESKGRKGTDSHAIADIFLKKSQYPNHSAKYGIIAHIPRNGDRVTLRVVDPEHEPSPVPRYRLMRQILSHYVRLSYLSGFWRLGDLLKSRIHQLNSDIALTRLQGNSLQYGNVLKLGYSLGVSLGTTDFDFFIPRDSINGFRYQYEDQVSVFAMDAHVIELLNQQLFDKLEYYSLPNNIDTHSMRIPTSIENDGSLLAVFSQDEISKYT